MLAYPSIPKKIPVDLLGRLFYVFGKLDGSQIRADWSVKRGFYKFGTRKAMIGSEAHIFLEAEGLIRRHESAIGAILRSRKWARATLFFEFHGPSSFAGEHLAEPHTVTLFDVAGPKGIVHPGDFIRTFPLAMPTAPLLHYGLVDEEFFATVRAGTLAGMPPEGVVCKGPPTTSGHPEMFKVKTDAWIARVQAKYGHRPDLLLDKM